MRSIFTSRWAKASIAAVIAGLGLVATTTGAEARHCGYWRNGYCADWRHTYNPGPAAALNAFGNVLGAAIASSQPRYYYPPPPAYTYYPPPYRYYPQPYYPAPSYGYYGPEPTYGLVIR